jgi:hypothetical protein
VRHGNHEQQESDDRNDCEKCAPYESRPHGPHRRSSLPTPTASNTEWSRWKGGFLRG